MGTSEQTFLGIDMPQAKQRKPVLVDANRIKKGFLLYLFLFPLFLSVVIALFRMDLDAFALNGIAFLLFFAVLWLSKKGFAQEINYRHARFARAPRIRYKFFAALLLALSTFYAAFVAGTASLFESLFWAGLSIPGYWLYYGFDPTVEKLEDFGDISADLVFETLREAHEKIDRIEENMEKIRDGEVHQRVEQALRQAQIVLDAIADDPGDIRSARKFLIVYIDGVAKVTSSYTAMDEQEIDRESRSRLLELMRDVERRFQKELKRLKANNQFDLDVQIDVLKEQIKH